MIGSEVSLSGETNIMLPLLLLLSRVNAQVQYGDYGLTGQGDYGRGFGDYYGFVPLQQEAADPCGLDPTGCYLEQQRQEAANPCWLDPTGCYLEIQKLREAASPNPYLEQGFVRSSRTILPRQRFGSVGAETGFESHPPPSGGWKVQDCKNSEWTRLPYCKCVSKCTTGDRACQAKCNHETVTSDYQNPIGQGASVNRRTPGTSKYKACPGGQKKWKEDCNACWCDNGKPTCLQQICPKKPHPPGPPKPTPSTNRIGFESATRKARLIPAATRKPGLVPAATRKARLIPAATRKPGLVPGGIERAKVTRKPGLVSKPGGSRTTIGPRTTLPPRLFVD